MKQDNTKYFIYGGVALLAYIGVVRPIFKKLGLAKGEESKNVENAETAQPENNPFKPDYYKIQHKKLGIPVKLKTQSSLAYLFKQLQDGFGYFYDDEEKIKGVFLILPNKMQVSQLSEYVQLKTGMPLITFLKTGKTTWNAGSGLNDVEINQIIDIVNKKPIYTK